MWVAVDGPYNEHLVRDIGQLNLALCVVTVVAVVTMQRIVVLAAGGAWFANGVPHLIYHARHLDNYDTVDQIGNIISLGLLAALPLLVLTGVRNQNW